MYSWFFYSAVRYAKNETESIVVEGRDDDTDLGQFLGLHMKVAEVFGDSVSVRLQVVGVTVIRRGGR
eukprot:SAG11_NODE_25339_length_360_cov_0.762452_1_plen_66_part_01